MYKTRLWFSERLTAMVQAMYPGFSRGSILAHTKMNTPMYHGIAPRRKPMMNLEDIKKKTDKMLKPSDCNLKLI